MINIGSTPESVPVPNDDDDDILEEDAEDLLKRLEDEKQDWQAQLAKMKATLEAQDRRIEEDREKLREVLKEEENSPKKSQVVAAKRAPARKVVRADKIGKLPTSSPRIPGITEHARTVWPSIQEFHNMRARTVAKAAPFAASVPELYLQSYGVVNPPRYFNPGYPTGYPAALSAHNNQGFVVDGMGRMVRPAKVLGYSGGSNSTTSSYLTAASLRPTTLSNALPDQTTTTGGWFTGWFGGTTSAPVVQTAPSLATTYSQPRVQASPNLVTTYATPAVQPSPNVVTSYRYV